MLGRVGRWAVSAIVALIVVVTTELLAGGRGGGIGQFITISRSGGGAMDVVLAGALTAGIITLSLNAGAYMTEIVRGGIQSVDKGQMEAARSLGIGYLPTMRKVILPQAIRTMIPSYINQFVITLKDTSILSVIGIAELTQTGRLEIARNFQSFEMWLIVGIIYFIVIMALTKLSDRLEKRLVK